MESTCEQHAEVLSFPPQCSGVERKGLLPVAEGARMVHAPTRSMRAWENLMKHLVKHNEIDEEPRYRRLVKCRVKTDFPGLMVIDTEPYGLAPATARTSTPTNSGSNSTLEVQLVQLLENLAQVVGLAARREDFVSCIPMLTDAWLLPPDEVIEEPTGAAVPTAGIVGNRPHHRSRRIEKHVMQP